MLDSTWNMASPLWSLSEEDGMTGQGGRTNVVATMRLVFCGRGGGITFPLFAEGLALDLDHPEARQHTLEKQIGKRVKIRLVSGQDLEGKVPKVWPQPVIISEMIGLEFSTRPCESIKSLPSSFLFARSCWSLRRVA